MKIFISILILHLARSAYSYDTMLDSSFDADFYADLAEYSCQDNFCNLVDLIGPPPDMIQDLPPPPIPSFLKGLDILNDSNQNSDSKHCNHCGVLTMDSHTIDGLSFTLPKPSPTNPLNNSILISIALLIISCLSLIALFLKYKKMKISMMDACTSISHNFFKNKGLEVSSQINCAPVVNEKSSQSIITNLSKKSTIIPAKYWKTQSENCMDMNFPLPNNVLMTNELDGSLINSRMTTEIGQFMSEENSCTSSPVYAELDSNNHQIGFDNISNSITLKNLNNPIINSQQLGYKSYTMRNYNELSSNAMNINQINQLNKFDQLNNQISQDNSLLAETSYDNEAYRPSSYDYPNKSFDKRFHRQSTLIDQSKLGSKTLLLNANCSKNANQSLTLGYMNGEKPKQTFIQHQFGGRINVNNTLMLANEDQIYNQPRYVQGNKKNILIYNGQPIISNPTNFGTTIQQKRPLPKLPNNFI